MTSSITKLSLLGLGGVSLILFALAATIETAYSSSENDNDNDAAIQEKMDKIDDQTKEMAESAFLNGTCLQSLDKMKILAHPDSEVASLGIEIPTC